jgi:hypothetical protein
LDSASTAAVFLAAIAVSDGLRLLPAGAIVVSRMAFGEWSVAWVNPDPQAGGRLRLITWCSPLLLPQVLGGTDNATMPLGRRVARFRKRARRTRSYVAALRGGGILTLAALVIGVPSLTARSGIWGLLLGVAFVIGLSAVQATLASAAFRRAGATTGRAILRSARYLWPFSAPRAAEDVMSSVTEDIPPLVLLGELLPPDAFRRFARPLLFDAVVRNEHAEGVAALRAHMGESQVAEILTGPPSEGDGDAFCPRCGASFYRGARFCSDCAGVELRPQPVA